MGDSIIQVRIRVSDDGTASIIDQTAGKLESLGQSAEKGRQGVFGLGYSLTELKSGFDIIKGGLTDAYGLINSVNDLGVASLRAKAGFEAMGGSTRVLEDMQAKTKGLVDDTKLMQVATQAMSAGAVQSNAQLAEMSRIGATLGLTFKGSAEQGIELFSRDLEAVGNKRGLKELGIDATDVEKRFKELRGTMSDERAWNMAVFEIAGKQADKLNGALDGTGTAFERLKVRVSNAVEQMAENVATGVESIIKSMDQIDQYLAVHAAVGLAMGIGKLTSGGSYETIGGPGTTPTGRPPGPPVPGDLGLGMTANEYERRHSGYTYGQSVSTVNAPWTAGGTAFGPVAGSYNYGGPGYTGNMMLNAGFGGGAMGQTGAYLQSEYGGMFDKARGIIGQMTGGWVDIQVAWDHFIGSMRPVKEYAHSMAEAFGTGQYSKNGLVGIGGELEGDLQSDADWYAQHQKRKIGSSKYWTPGTPGVDMKEFNKEQQQEAERFRYEHAGDKNYTEEYKEFQHGQLGRKIAAEDSGTPGHGSGPVYTKANYEADIESEQKGLERYQIAMGLATKESIAFGHAKEDLSKAFRSGKISFDQEIDGLIALGKAAAEGRTSMKDLYKIMVDMGQMKPLDALQLTYEGPSTDASGKQLSPAERARQWRENKQGGGPATEGGQNDNPFAPVKKSADEAHASINKLGPASMLQVAQVGLASLGMALGMRPAQNAVTTLVSYINGIGSAIRLLDGQHFTIHGSVESGGGGGLDQGHARPGSGT